MAERAALLRLSPGQLKVAVLPPDGPEALEAIYSALELGDTEGAQVKLIQLMARIVVVPGQPLSELGAARTKVQRRKERRSKRHARRKNR